MTAFIFKKESRGCSYYYAAENHRVNGKHKRKWEVYLGPADKIVEKIKQGPILPNDMHATPYGLYSALVEMAKEIKLVGSIDQIFPKREQGLTIGEYFLFGILGRMTKPRTKNTIQQWYESNEIEKIYPIEPKYLTVQNYWNNMESLDYDKMNDVHNLLIKNINEKYKLQTTYIYFDPTNFHTFMENKSENSTIPMPGCSKKKRFDLPIVNLALSVTKGDAIPTYHQTYHGNINDVGFFKENVDSFIKCSLKNTHQKELVVVFDKGNNAKEVFEALSDFKKPNVKFIGALRPSTQKEIFSTPVEQLKDSYETDSGNIIKFKSVEVTVYDKDYRAVLTYDDDTYGRKCHTWQKNKSNVLAEAEEFVAEKLNVKKWRNKESVEKKLESICSQKNMKEVLCFDVTGEYGELSVSLFWDVNKEKDKMNSWGKNLIFTSIEKKKGDIVDIIKGYRLKNDIEECFRILNNNYLLSVRPIHHWNDQMIKAHMATCVMGLTMIQLIRKRLRMANIKMSIEEVFERLMDIQLVRSDYKKWGTAYQLSKMNQETKKMAKTLGVRLELPDHLSKPW